MTVRRNIILALFLWIAMWPLPGRAHGIRIFATVEGTTICGSVYVSGGTPLPGASVAAYASEGGLVARSVADEKGHFTLPAGEGGPLLLVAETADGHRAEFTVAATQEPPPGPAGASSPGPSLPEEHLPPAAHPHAFPDAHELTGMVEAAVARQLRPLREQLDQEAHRRRLQDVLGGLGYIAGFAGLAMYLMARKKSGRKDE